MGTVGGVAPVREGRLFGLVASLRSQNYSTEVVANYTFLGKAVASD